MRTVNFHIKRYDPARDDERWLRHTMAYYTPEGPRLEYEPVALGTFEPQERKY
jgi:succinate dehydrogenase / fumarate reductase flavoprotein subunit